MTYPFREGFQEGDTRNPQYFDFSDIYWWLLDNIFGNSQYASSQAQDLATVLSQVDISGYDDNGQTQLIRAYSDNYKNVVNYLTQYRGKDPLTAQKLTADMLGKGLVGLPQNQFSQMIESYASNPELDKFIAQQNTQQILAEQEKRQKQLGILSSQQIEKGSDIYGQELAKIRSGQVSAALGAAPSPAQLSAGVTAGVRSDISPAASRYFESRLPQIYQETGMPQQRTNWQQDLMSSILRTGIPEQRPGDKSFTQQVAASDPWSQYLARLKASGGLIGQFKSLTPRERGYYSGILRPRTRTLK